jgi:hypothetical protein
MPDNRHDRPEHAATLRGRRQRFIAVRLPKLVGCCLAAFRADTEQFRDNS